MAIDLSFIPTMDEVPRRAKQKAEIPTRLEEKEAKRKDETKAEQKWRAAIWRRDAGKCRWCRRHVAKTIELVAERGECHHIVGRANPDTRWEPRNGVLLCLSCHERITGKVNEKHIVVAAETYAIEGVEYPDGSKPVHFKRVV